MSSIHRTVKSTPCSSGASLSLVESGISCNTNQPLCLQTFHQVPSSSGFKPITLTSYENFLTTVLNNKEKEKCRQQLGWNPRPFSLKTNALPTELKG